MKKQKTKEELIEMAQPYFDAYPDVEVFIATPDGQFFTEKNKSSAKSHAKSIDASPHEIRRNGGDKPEAVIDELPEGNPNKEGWTIPQIQKWLSDREVKFTKNSKEDKLLEKVEEYLKSQTGE